MRSAWTRLVALFCAAAMLFALVQGGRRLWMCACTGALVDAPPCASMTKRSADASLEAERSSCCRPLDVAPLARADLARAQLAAASAFVPAASPPAVAVAPVRWLAPRVVERSPARARAPAPPLRASLQIWLV